MLARIQLLSPPLRGQPVQVRLLIDHPMETGLRFDFSGNAVPKNVVHTLQADYAGQTVFRAKFGPGISANPFLQFWLLPTESGRLRVHWHDDLG
ncbi:MAG: thiosulfate oxidation carrier complex protein SoxZ, partial [Betaproteobacteria bacterium]